MEAACALYERLGFLLTPLSVHSGSNKPGEPVQVMATGNRCAVFPHNYIEVLGIVNPGALDWGWSRFIDRFEGAHIICFGCQDAEVVAKRLDSSGVANSGVIALQRDIGTLEGTKTARFDCVHFNGASTPEGLIQAARHRNPEYVHQSRYLSHANGATGLAQLLIVTEDPNATAERYTVLTGRSLTEVDGLPAIDLPLVTTLRFTSPSDAGRRLPGTLLSPTPSIVAATFTVADLGAARRHITEAGFPVVDGEDRFHVPAEHVLGVVHEFIPDRG
jgi:hypothetical protein